MAVIYHWWLLCVVDTSNTEGERVAFNQLVIFVQRAGGFGGRRSSDKGIMAVAAPEREPDVSVCEKTAIDQVQHDLSHSLSFLQYLVPGLVESGIYTLILLSHKG